MNNSTLDGKFSTKICVSIFGSPKSSVLFRFIFFADVSLVVFAPPPPAPTAAPPPVAFPTLVPSDFLELALALISDFFDPPVLFAVSLIDFLSVMLKFVKLLRN